MRKCLSVILMSGALLSAFGQTPSSNYQPGVIMAVKAHLSPGQSEADATQYDVSVKVGNTTYVVLFTSPNGSNSVKYVLGEDLLVLVGSKTLTFNSPSSGKTEVPILSRETGAAQSFDPSQPCGQYLTKKMQHLSEVLTLTESQQAAIKPIVEQEAGEVGEVCYNPALSYKDKMNQYEKIVRASDEKIKPLLTASQVQKLQDLRKEQKQELKKVIAEQKSSKPS